MKQLIYGGESDIHIYARTLNTTEIVYEVFEGTNSITVSAVQIAELRDALNKHFSIREPLAAFDAAHPPAPRFLTESAKTTEERDYWRDRCRLAEEGLSALADMVEFLGKYRNPREPR